MKKYRILLISVFAVLFLVAALLAFRAEMKSGVTVKTPSAGGKVEVLYFHMTRRCVTCLAVENVSRDAVNELYPEEIKKGQVEFRSLDIEDKRNTPDAERVKATGQCLLVVSGETRIDLTSQGFMYARTKPEMLKEEIKKAVDPLLKKD